MADNPHPLDNPPVAADELTAFNGLATVPDTITGARPVLQAVGVAVSTGDGLAEWASDTQPLATKDGGTFGYRAGTAPATVDVPALARLRRVYVAAGLGGIATVTIGGGDTITVPQADSFEEAIPGSAIGADVVIAGAVASYYVSWVT
jgi:hypothetical protein